jgi:recombinational DNA repair protein RecT
MSAPAKTATVSKAARKKVGAAKKASAEVGNPTHVTNPEKMSPKGMAEELLVQTDLASMDARDQWSKVTADVDQRRQKVERAVRELMTGGNEASRSLLAGVREAVEEMREAVDKATKSFR